MDFVGRPFVVRSFGLYCMELGRQRLLVAVVERCFLLDRQHIVLFDTRLPNRSREKIDKNVIKRVNNLIAMKFCTNFYFCWWLSSRICVWLCSRLISGRRWGLLVICFGCIIRATIAIIICHTWRTSSCEKYTKNEEKIE